MCARGAAGGGEALGAGPDPPETFVFFLLLIAGRHGASVYLERGEVRRGPERGVTGEDGYRNVREVRARGSGKGSGACWFKGRQ